MKKGIVVILVVLLIISIGFGIYSFQKSVKTEKSLQVQIDTLTGENGALRQKIAQGLAYAKALDVLYEPVRKQMSLPTRYNLSDMEWMSEFSNTTKAAGDDTLSYLFQDIQKGGSASEMATVRFIERVAVLITDLFK